MKILRKSIKTQPLERVLHTAAQSSEADGRLAGDFEAAGKLAGDLEAVGRLAGDGWQAIRRLARDLEFGRRFGGPGDTSHTKCSAP